jgi:magnesium-transporting ATPase (P-type)
MTTPFFVIQDIFSIIYIITGFLAFGVALLTLTIITTSVNYVFLYFSYLKIRKMAEKNIEIKVIRENKIEIIDSRELVPGDVIIP